MKILNNPYKGQWKELLQRPYVDNTAVLQSVQNILDEIKMKGDVAIRDFTKELDGIEIQNFKVSEEEITNAESQLSTELKQAIYQAKKNIETFHLKYSAPIAVRQYCQHKDVATILSIGLFEVSL